MAEKATDIFAIVNKEDLDVGFSLRRHHRSPLDENSLFTTYAKLEEEMKNEHSSIYKGQIVVTQGSEEDKTPTYFMPFLIKNDNDQSKVSYYADKILTASYQDNYLDKVYVKKSQLGTYHTGVGQWADVQGLEMPSYTYSELFNDYKGNIISLHEKNDLTQPYTAYAHVEGAGNYVDMSYTHAEGLYTAVYNGMAGHVEGIGSIVRGIAAHAEGSAVAEGAYSHAGGDKNTRAEGAYSFANGIGAQAKGTGSMSVGNNTIATGISSVAMGTNTQAKGEYTVALGNNTQAIGSSSMAEGYSSYAYGVSSHAEGYNSYSVGNYSHAEGYNSYANKDYSHAEGNSIANGTYSHAEGQSNALGNYAHAEGQGQANKDYSHAEGKATADGNYSHAEGQAIAEADSSHAEGLGTAFGLYSHAEGKGQATGTASHAEGTSTAQGDFTHAEGEDTKALDRGAHSEGYQTTAYLYSHAEGYKTWASGQYAHAEGYNSYATSMSAHSEGLNTHAQGEYTHVEGNGSIAQGNYSHAEGLNSVSYGLYAHTEGNAVNANGIAAHGEGNETSAEGNYSHTEGYKTTAIGEGSHAEGYQNTASGNYTHAEGYGSQAIGYYSHAGGYTTYARAAYSFTGGFVTTTYGTASMAIGAVTHARGNYSFASGYMNISPNSYEFSTGVMNRSYTTSGEEAEKINDVPNEFARIAGKYIPGRYPTGITDDTKANIAHYDSSYETIFTIGNGSTTDTSVGPNPLDINEGQDAGQYVKSHSRHNVMDIRKNGQMYYDGGMIVGGEIVAPMSYSYVASLGPTAYLTTVMRALLVQPEYYRPSLQYALWYTGNSTHNATTSSNSVGWAYFRSGTSSDGICEVGASTNFQLQFRAFNVGVNKPENLDPLYGTSLGNMLGYSTGVTNITYQIIKTGNLSTQEFNTYQDSELLAGMQDSNVKCTPKKIDASNYDYGGLGPFDAFRKDYTAQGTYAPLAYYCSYCNAVDSKGAFGESNGNYSKGLYSSQQVVASSIKFDKEGKYTIWKATSYTFNPATQMYFQQLAEKGTYVPDDGVAPLDKFYETTVNSSATFTMTIRYRIYYGVTNTVPDDTWKSWTQTDLLGHGEFAHAHRFGALNASTGNTEMVTQGFNSTAKTCWFAFPDDIYELTRYNHAAVPSNRYMYFKNAMNAESSLDTGRITDTVSSARPMYEYTTTNGISPSGLKYHIVAVSAPAGITKGTWGFAFKRK